MANNVNIEWSTKGSTVVGTFGFESLEEECTGKGENRYCPAFFEKDEIITFPDKEYMEFFKRPFTKRDGSTDFSIMLKVHSSVRGEYFADITDFLRIPIPAECGQFFKESPISYTLLKVLGNDIQRIKYLMGKQIAMHTAMELHRFGWTVDEDGVRHMSEADEDLKKLTCWAWMEI